MAAFQLSLSLLALLVAISAIAISESRVARKDLSANLGGNVGGVGATPNVGANIDVSNIIPPVHLRVGGDGGSKSSPGLVLGSSLRSGSDSTYGSSLGSGADSKASSYVGSGSGGNQGQGVSSKSSQGRGRGSGSGSGHGEDSSRGSGSESGNGEGHGEGYGYGEGNGSGDGN